jgi:hypothetical protein
LEQQPTTLSGFIAKARAAAMWQPVIDRSGGVGLDHVGAALMRDLLDVSAPHAAEA